MAEIGVDAECDDRNAQTRCRRDKSLTDTARDRGCATARIEHAERLDHARDRTQEAEQRGNRDNRAQIVEIATEANRFHRHTVGKRALHRGFRGCVFDAALDDAGNRGGELLAELADRVKVLLHGGVIDPVEEHA